MLSQQYLEQVTLRRDIVPSFDEYPFCLAAVRELTSLKLHPKVTFLVGENGSGKSTLLEAIAVGMGFNAEGGTKNFNFATRRSHSNLSDFLRLAQGFRKPKDGFFLRAESFFNVATQVDELHVGEYYGGTSLHEMSHGESFMALMINRFGGKGLYLLDEPEAALSPQRQLATLSRMHDLVLDDSQFVIATHSPILMAYPDAWIYQLDASGVRRVDYQDTEHYQVTRNFLANPQPMMGHLFEK